MAIEPEPQNLRLLKRNLADNDLHNVTVHACAVGATEEIAKLGIYKPANRGRHSLVDLQSCEQYVDVPVRRLDDLVRDAGVSSWALLKLDVEGFEPFVFQGATETLSRTEALAMEYAPVHWRAAGINPSDVLGPLAGSFPRISRFEGTSLAPISVQDCLRINSTTEVVFQR